MHPFVLLLSPLLLAGSALAAETSVETSGEHFRREAQPLPVPPYRPPLAQAPVGKPRWEVRVSDVTLARTLDRWAQQAGYRVRWDAARNFLVGAPDSFEGTIEDAMAKLLGSAGIRHSDYPLEVCIYANTPPLMRVTRAGEQAQDCAADVR